MMPFALRAWHRETQIATSPARPSLLYNAPGFPREPVRMETRMDARNGDRETTPPPSIEIAGALALAAAVGVSRLVAHPWNIPPVDGLCLFLGARFRSWFAFAIPIAMRVVTDVILMIWLRPIGVELSLVHA